MRLMFWGLVVIAFFYGAYAVMMSGWQYFQVAGVVDEVLQPRSMAEHGTPRGLKTKILQEAAEAGVPLSEHDVSVTVVERFVTVTIIWSFPVIIFKGEPVLSIPITLKREKQTGGSAYRPEGRAFASAIIRSTRVRSSPGGVSVTNRSHERIAPAASFFVS